MTEQTFLLKEYELCYEQLRYYDTRHSSTLKYLIALTSSMATAMFAIYKLFGVLNNTFYIVLSLLSFVVFIGSIILYLLMLQNRVYFVLIAKQINSLRRYFCDQCPSFENQLWVSTTISPFKLFSVHSFQMLGAVVVSSLFAASGIHSLYPILGHEPNLKRTFVFFIVMVFFLTASGALYLVLQGHKKGIKSRASINGVE
jgi:hypothetical protein